MSTISTEAPLTQSEYAEQLCRAIPDLRIIGSFGRAAHMGCTLELMRSSGVARDVDAVRLNAERLPLEGPELDLLFEHWIQTEPDGTTHLVFPHDPRLAVEVPHAEDVFAPEERRVNGSTICVPHADTLGAISTMQYIQRPKDSKAMESYGAFLDSLSPHERLPKELLEPFNVFRTELASRRGYLLRAHARNTYHRLVPEQTRKQWQVGEKIDWLRSK